MQKTLTNGTITVKINISAEMRPYTFSITFENGLISEYPWQAFSKYSDFNERIEFITYQY